MAVKKVIVHNKSDRPDNIVEKETEIFQECEKLEQEMPKFLRGFFVYLKGNVLSMTRLAYLHDLKFFFTYLINEPVSIRSRLTTRSTITRITTRLLRARNRLCR